MANEKYLELAKKLDDRFLEVAGKTYEHLGKGHKQNRVGISTLVKEFNLSAVTVNEYLTVFHQPLNVLRMIAKGGWWAWWVEAIRAPESIQEILFQKILNNEFSNRDEVRKFIDEHKNLTEASEVITPVAEIPGIGDVPEQANWSQYVRDQFTKEGQYDPTAASQFRFGNMDARNVSRMRGVAYALRREFRKKFNKKLVQRDGIFHLVEPSTPTSQESQGLEEAVRSKTAVLVAREIHTLDGTKYELDIVGDFNRGMMKETLKQLMEVFI